MQPDFETAALPSGVVLGCSLDVAHHAMKLAESGMTMDSLDYVAHAFCAGMVTVACKLVYDYFSRYINKPKGPTQ
jgi:hypothetical protein